MKAIKNYDEVFEDIVNALKEHHKNIRQYEEDIYLCYNKNKAHGTVFTLGPGESYNDDYPCYFLYTIKNEMQSVFEFYNNEKELAEDLKLSDSELRLEVIKYLEDEDFDELSQEEIENYELDFYDYRDYIESVDEYMNLLKECYANYIDNGGYDEWYEDKAREIFEDLPF